MSIIAQHGNADMQHLRSLGRRRLIDFLDKDTRHAPARELALHGERRSECLLQPFFEVKHLR